MHKSGGVCEETECLKKERREDKSPTNGEPYIGRLSRAAKAADRLNIQTVIDAADAYAAAGFLLEICTSTNGYASRGRVGQSGFWEQYLFSEAVTALLKMLQTDTSRHVFDHVFPHTDTADTLSERLLSIADSALTDPRVRSRMAKP